MLYLHRRGPTYYFLRRIPDHLTHHYGKTHLRYSLKTKDLHVARRLRNQEAARLDREFAELETTGETHSEAIANQLNHLWRNESPQYEAVSFAYEGLVESKKIPDETLKEAHKLHQNTTEGVFTLRDLIDEHRANHTNKLPKESTRNEYETSYELLLSIFSPHKAVTEIGRKEAREFREILENLPPNFRKRKQTAGKPPRTVAEIARADDTLPKPKPATVNKKLTFVNALFNYAALEEHIPKNPFSRLAAKDPEAAKDKRSVFTEGELKALFKHLPEGSMEYWTTLIALHQGMRMGEILQLKVRDISKVRDVWTINIHAEDEDNTVKTGASVRTVPIHQRLLDLGILELTEDKSEDSLVFPSARLGHDGKYSTWYSKEYRKILKRADVHVNRRKTFHSFRHVFRDACRDAEIPTEVANMLGGWSNQGVSASYGQGASMGVLKKALDGVTYVLYNRELRFS